MLPRNAARGSGGGSEVAIAAHDVGKRYKVVAAHKAGRSTKEEYWALREVSFEVLHGQVLGIVGRNGAGKSTLLKILSRITNPTTGRVVLRGRVAGLLEVGTGFHPELTGRDNVFLNGTLMGMSRSEVRRRFDEIVDFAGVEYFLDTPVKRYSSGMYVRLAFAVAAHLSNDILILDEVLAVGDAAFQRKCLGKMRELAAGEGRTVLIVSHNADVIRRNAERALRLDRGRLVLDSSVERVLEDYEQFDVAHLADVEDAERVDPNWGRLIRMLRVEVLGGGTVPMGGDLVYEVTVRLTRDLEVGVGQAVISLDDRPIATSFSRLTPLGPGTRTLRVRVPLQHLAPGRYSLNVVVGQGSFAAPDLHYDGVMHPVTFEVQHVDPGSVVDWHPEWWGSIALEETQIEMVD